MRFLMVVVLCFGIAACNTAQGVKKDVAIGAEKTGEALQKGGEAVENALHKGGEVVGGALKKGGEAVQKVVD
ncbi:MAG: entericidin EcnAB [Dechloromonas sp.]|nr:entericidin EcnAB [Dechloromonas sp.]